MGTLKAGEPGNFSLHTSGGNVLAEQLVFAKIYLQDDYLLGHHYQVTLLPLHVCREGGGESLLSRFNVFSFRSWEERHALGRTYI